MVLLRSSKRANQTMRIALGWTPDLTDPRDIYFEESELSGLGLIDKSIVAASTSLMLCEATTDFVLLESDACHQSVACSVLALLDWQSRRNDGESLRRSPSFLHQTTTRIAGGGGIQGVGFRSVFKTLKRFGSPPFELWSANLGTDQVVLDKPELYGYSSDFSSLKYVRIEDRSGQWEKTVNKIKKWLSLGNPCLFGFCVPDYVEEITRLAVPANTTRILGGSSAIIVGYDDILPVGGDACPRGAFYFRSCWDTGWGENGHGWLPYELVYRRFALDFWGVINHRIAMPFESPYRMRTGSS